MFVRATDLMIGDKVQLHYQGPLVEITYIYQPYQRDSLVTQTVLCSDGIERRFVGTQQVDVRFRITE